MSHILLTVDTEALGFDRAICLCSEQDWWGIYSNDPGIVGPYGTPLLFKGTESQVVRMAAQWDQDPETYYSQLFAWRQAAQVERRSRQRAAEARTQAVAA